MQETARKLERYLDDALGVTIAPVPWERSSLVPFYLQESYHFLVASVLGRPCLFMIDRSTEEKPPTVVGKHMAQLQARWDDAVIYVRERITAYNRKRLIQQRVPFVVPGTQMYMPMLAIDLRERFSAARVESPKLSPAAQAVLIHGLLPYTEPGLTPGELAARLGYTPMTMGRALDEIEVAELGTAPLQGRERRLRLEGEPHDVWRRAQSLLRDPARQRRHVLMRNHTLPVYVAGLSALAQCSMLAEPGSPVIAVSRDTFKALEENGAMRTVPMAEPDTVVLEVWRYAPDGFARNGLVDSLSLYLSLCSDRDERIQAALEELMGMIGW
jgi:DNA-binding transcriptional ArsR family regulator